MLTPFDEPIHITRPLLPDLKEYTAKLREIWDNKWLTNNGSQLRGLESSLVNYLKVPHLSLFNNGTIALLAALEALGLSGEIITSPFTFPAAPATITWRNLTPVFSDINPRDMNMNPERIEDAITSRSSAILATHVFGIPCEMEAISDIAQRRGLKVIYDAAHAFGAEVNGRGIGTYGDVSMFSFHATKLFHTAEGGALSSSDESLKHRFELLKNFGIKNEDEVILSGINGKMNELQAALGLVVLNHLTAEREKRRLLEIAYRERLGGIEGLILPPSPPELTRASLQYFVIRIDEVAFGISRDELHTKLKEYNVFTRKYFYPLCSDYPVYKQLPSASTHNLPVAAKSVKETLTLPFYGELAEEDVERICEMIRDSRG